MKITGLVETEAVTDIVCDVCQLTTRLPSGGLQFATLRADWGYGSKHDGERYEIHLCEGCFFQAVPALNRSGAHRAFLATLAAARKMISV